MRNFFETKQQTKNKEIKKEVRLSLKAQLKEMYNEYEVFRDFFKDDIELNDSISKALKNIDPDEFKTSCKSIKVTDGPNKLYAIVTLSRINKEIK